jgi:hypothetical protein
MSFVWKKSFVSEREFVKMTGLAPLTEWIGSFAGLVENKFGNLSVVLKNGTREIHLPASGSLKYQLQSVPAGSTVKIVYKGKEILKKGPMAGRAANQFDVFVADDAMTNLVEAAEKVNAKEIAGDVVEALAQYESQKREVGADDLSDVFG